MKSGVASSSGFLRYPGGKARLIPSFASHLPKATEIRGNYVEPFLGGGAVFFYLNPNRAILSDINTELIDLYKGVKSAPDQVWTIYRKFPATKAGYYKVRSQNPATMDIAHRAARLLYINRTCFKGMWRHNSRGSFNVGYGGEERRWVVTLSSLRKISKRLQSAELYTEDFEYVISRCKSGDFLFLDPPYKPGERELKQAHYSYGKFSFSDQLRLAKSLVKATKRGVKWAMTNSSHPSIVALYVNHNVFFLPRGTGANIGQIALLSGEVLITNY